MAVSEVWRVSVKMQAVRPMQEVVPLAGEVDVKDADKQREERHHEAEDETDEIEIAPRHRVFPFWRRL
jgi:hypothetical protein